MSYDLMVFDPAVAPRKREAFLAWYDAQTQWTESHGYNDPEIPAPSLRTWFQEMIQVFPPMNGPLAVDDPDNLKLTDFSLGRSVIYAAFAWSEAETARQRMIALAAKHKVGFYDVSSEDGGIYWPSEGNALEILTE